MPRSLVPLLLVLLGFAIVVTFLVGSIRSDVRRLRRGSAALQPAQDPPEQGRVFEAPRPEDPLSALRRIAAIDPSSLGIAVLPVAAAIVIGVLAALVGVGFLVIGVVLWLFGPHNLAAWFVVVGSLLAMVAYRSLRRVVRAWRRRGFVFVMDQVPGWIGRAVGGTLEFPAGRQPAGPVEATLACLSVLAYRPGVGVVSRADIQTLWSRSRTMQMTGTSDRFSVSFDVPSGLPSSYPSPSLLRTSIVWRLTVESMTGGGLGNIAFVLPVHSTVPAP